jgi:hypothetical protein
MVEIFDNRCGINLMWIYRKLCARFESPKSGLLTLSSVESNCESAQAEPPERHEQKGKLTESLEIVRTWFTVIPNRTYLRWKKRQLFLRHMLHSVFYLARLHRQWNGKGLQLSLLHRSKSAWWVVASIESNLEPEKMVWACCASVIHAYGRQAPAAVSAWSATARADEGMDTREDSLSATVLA